MILGIIDKYFTVAEDLYRIRILSKNNIQRFLMLLYFPLIISSKLFKQIRVPKKSANLNCNKKKLIIWNSLANIK